MTDLSGVDEPDTERRFVGVAVATVVDNVDLTGQSRVQLSLPWMPESAPWARVATPLAGPDTGLYLMPQPGDEVLVSFHHGDPAEPFVVGCLWNGQDTPPTETPYSAQSTFRLRTPLGHDVTFDDASQTVTLTTTVEHTVELTPGGIRIATANGAAAITLGADGAVAVSATGTVTMEAAGITLKAPTIKLEGSDVGVTASTHCGITAAMVDIN